MKKSAAILGLCIVTALPTTAVACSMKLSEFRKHLLSFEDKLGSYEAQTFKQNNKVRGQSKQVMQVPYGTECSSRLKSAIAQTQTEVADLNSQLAGFDKEDDAFFSCILDLRKRGGAALDKAKAAGDTTRVLRVQQALKDLTDYDVQAIELSIRMDVIVSKVTRLQRETERSLATCSPSEGGLDAIDF